MLYEKNVTHLSNFRSNPHTVNMYSQLKALISDQFFQSGRIKLRMLFKELQLGYKGSSQLLLEVRNLPAVNVSKEELKFRGKTFRLLSCSGDGW